jgi:hypothetical protein
MKRTAFAFTALAYLLSAPLSATTYQKAFKELDCQFKDCSTPKVIEPKVIEKEKIIYVDKPIVQEKVIYVDKPIVQEKIVEKVIYKEVAASSPKPAEKPTDGLIYDKAFIDIASPNDAKFVQDYLSYTKRAGGFDWAEIGNKLRSGPNGRWTVKITGNIEFPQNIDAKEILIKQTGVEYRNITIDGIEFKAQDSYILTENRYAESKKIPYVIYASFCCHNGNSVHKWLEASIPNLNVYVSNKPQKRGEKEVFVPARFFIEE